MKQLFFGIIGVLLVGCSGGGTGNDAPLNPQAPVPTVNVQDPQGVWTGMTSHGRTLWGAIRKDGAYWFLYSAIGDPTVLRGAIQGTGVLQGDAFASIDMLDYSIDEGKILNATLAGTIVEKQTVTGTMTLSTGESVTFTLTYVPHLSEGTPNITQVAGTYLGNSSSNVHAPGTITITAATVDNFSINAVNGGMGIWNAWQSLICPTMSGHVMVSAQSFPGFGQVYTFLLIDDCVFPQGAHNQSGLAIFDPATNTLMLFAQNIFASDPFKRTKAFVYRGIKQ